MNSPIVTVSSVKSTSTSASISLVNTSYTSFPTHFGSKGLILFYAIRLRSIFSVPTSNLFFRDLLLRGWPCNDCCLSSFIDHVLPVCTSTNILLRKWSVWKSNDLYWLIILTHPNNFYLLIHKIRFSELGCIYHNLLTSYWNR